MITNNKKMNITFVEERHLNRYMMTYSRFASCKLVYFNFK
jgi:hypothetical protein